MEIRSTADEFVREGPCWLRLVFRFLLVSWRRVERLLMKLIFELHMQKLLLNYRISNQLNKSFLSEGQETNLRELRS